MKANKIMFGALMLAAVAMVSCDDSKKEPVVPVVPSDSTSTETLPEINAVKGKVVVAVNFATAPCNDVVATGDFVDGAWGADTKVKFEALSDGWYTATIEFVDAESYTTPDAYADARAQVKPIQLQGDGSFSWDGQWYGDGDKLVEVVEGVGYYLDYNESNGESQLILTADALGQVIYVKAYGWKVNPCVELPVAEEAWIKHASADEAENWVAEKMDKVSEGTFTHTFVYSDNGVNIGIDESCSGWYAPESIEGLDAETMAGKTIKVTFISEAGTKGIVKAELAE